MKSVTIGLVMVLGFLAIPQNLLAQTEPNPWDFEVALCRRIHGLDLRIVELRWEACLATFGLGGGSLCVGCIITAGPFAPACILLCIGVGLTALAAITQCWLDKEQAEFDVGARLRRCINDAVFGCV